MKNKILFLATTLLLVSCWENKNKGQQTDETGDSLVHLEFSKTYYNVKEKIFGGETPNYTINIKVNYADGDSKAAQLINKQLAATLFGITTMSFEDAKNHFADSLKYEYIKELKDFYDPTSDYPETFAYEYIQSGLISEDAPEGIIVYTNKVEMYTGGAHGGAMINYINFVEATGELITCEMLFGDKEEAVKKLIKEQIIKDNDCKTQAELEEKRSIFALGDVFINDNNFRIDKDGILFIYNPYDIAPWSEGFISAKLSYEQLKGLITPNIIKIN